MTQNFDSNSGYVITNRGEFYWIVCFAVIGVAWVLKTISDSSYQLGRDTKEREMKREYKKMWKKMKKQES